MPSHRTVSISLVFVVLFYVTYIFYTGHQALLSAMASLAVTDWLIILSCSLSNYLFRFLRWQVYLLKFNCHIPFFLSLAYYLAGFSLTTTPGKAGETIRSLYLHQHNVRFSISLAAFFTERFLDVIVVACLALLVLLHFVEYQSAIISTIIILLLMVALFAYGNTHHMLEKILPYMKVTFIHGLLNNLSKFLVNTSQLFSFKMFTTGLFLGAIAWLLQGMAFVYLLQHFEIELSLWIVIGIYAASLLAGAISFIPGGVGTTEAAMALLLISVGVDKQSALIIPVITRIASLWFAVILGSSAVFTLGMLGIKPREQHTRHSA